MNYLEVNHMELELLNLLQKENINYKKKKNNNYYRTYITDKGVEFGMKNVDKKFDGTWHYFYDDKIVNSINDLICLLR